MVMASRNPNFVPAIIGQHLDELPAIQVIHPCEGADGLNITPELLFWQGINNSGVIIFCD